MTSKDYELIARVVNSYREELSPMINFDRSRYAALRELANLLCDVFIEENPRFDRDRFMLACGFNDPKWSWDE